MDILILGGTSFVGRHLAEKAIARGHDVTLFNRGKSNPHLFADQQKITGDRRQDAAKLAGRKWDAVIDSSAYSPADLEPVLAAVETDLYAFISTISVYSDYSRGPAAENAPVHEPLFGSDEVTGATYGPLKVACEHVLNHQHGLRTLILRPGIVAGPHDPTDRFTYWAERLATNGPVLIPGGKERKLQWIDARDLAEFTLLQIERGQTGVFNVAADPVTMADFVEELAVAPLDLKWMADRRLLEKGIKPFQIPFWIPVSEDHPEGFIVVDNHAAKQHSLESTSAKETAEAVRQWVRVERGSAPLKAGLTAAEETALLYEDGQTEV